MEPLKKRTDEDLLELVKKGDRSAFTVIYERYFGPLYLHALKMLKDEDEAEDVIHELFINLWIRSWELQFKGTLAAYLYRAVKNRVINSLDHERIKQSYLDSLQAYINAGKWETEETVRTAELAREIEKEVARLPEKMREIFALSRNIGLSHKEIAAELGISDKTVKKQIHNAIRLLKVKFNALLFSVLL